MEMHTFLSFLVNIKRSICSYQFQRDQWFLDLHCIQEQNVASVLDADADAGQHPLPAFTLISYMVPLSTEIALWFLK